MAFVQQADAQDVVIVTGSLFVVGEVRAFLDKGSASADVESAK